MKHSVWREFRILLILITLLTVTLTASAQDGGDIIVVGSGVAGPLFQTLVESGENEAVLALEVTGTNTGFARFCEGRADITTSNRPMSAAENESCIANNINYVELPIAHDVVAFVVHPEADFATCLTRDQINTVFAPSTEASVTNWNQVIEEAPDTALSAFVPDEISSTYAILDRFVEGDGVRSDANTAPSGMDVITAVAETPGAIGVTSLAAAATAGDIVRILQIDAGLGCRAPDAEAVEGSFYAPADTLYVYANLASLDKIGLKDALAFASGASAAEIVASSGYIAPTDNTYTANANSLSAAESGVTVARATGDATIPTNLTGQIRLGGAAGARDYLQASIDAFKTLNASVVTETRFFGEPAGYRQFCNGEIEILSTYRTPSAEETDNCAANNIEPVTIDLGRQATVLLSNADSEFLACLSTGQIVDAWRAQPNGEITTWNQISPEFPDVPVVLLAPRYGSGLVDRLLLTASGASLAAREVTETNDDPLYRAAATANVAGALTVLSYADYQRVLANNQANVQLVSVDAGSGCVAPSPETIADGSYPLTLPVSLLVNKSALAVPETQAFALFLASNDNYINLEAQGFYGVRPGDLAAVRDRLQRAILEAEAEAAARAESTPEPLAETTPEAEATEESGGDS